jgi:hypothetical protein
MHEFDLLKGSLTGDRDSTDHGQETRVARGKKQFSFELRPGRGGLEGMPVIKFSRRGYGILSMGYPSTSELLGTPAAIAGSD